MTLPSSLGALREAIARGHRHSRTVKDELRDNLSTKLRNHEPLFPGIVGYDDTVIPQVANAIRPTPVLPYKPMSIGWMKRQFRGSARVDVISYGIPSVWCNQHVSEKTPIGQALWRAMIGLEKHFPHLSARLGNFVAIIAKKNG